MGSHTPHATYREAIVQTLKLYHPVCVLKTQPVTDVYVKLMSTNKLTKMDVNEHPVQGLLGYMCGQARQELNYASYKMVRHGAIFP